MMQVSDNGSVVGVLLRRAVELGSPSDALAFCSTLPCMREND